MKISQTFAGSYLKAADVPQPKLVTIEAVIMAKMPEGDDQQRGGDEAVPSTDHAAAGALVTSAGPLQGRRAGL